MGVRDVLERRHAERRALVDRARRYVEGLPGELGLLAAVVFGSVARGDFNRWSDVDLLLIAEAIEGDPLERAERLEPRPPRVRPIAWTPDEWRSERDRNPIAREALEAGVWLVGSPEGLAG